MSSILSTDCQTYELIWELTLNIFFHSPEMNRSIFFSMHFVVNDEKETLLFSIPHNLRKNIFLSQCPFNFFFQWRLFLLRSRQVLFFVILLSSLIDMQNLSHSVLTHFLRADLREYLVHYGSNSSQTYLIHEKF